MTMITRKEMSERWRRTLFHFAFALVVIFGVIISLVLKRVNGGDGPSMGTLAAIAAAFVVFSIALFFSGRFIKNMIWRKFGEDWIPPMAP
jgi:Kef-type K+ transport system membrane component KefB